jgi:hypothetical protein
MPKARNTIKASTPIEHSASEAMKVIAEAAGAATAAIADAALEASKVIAVSASEAAKILHVRSSDRQNDHDLLIQLNTKMEALQVDVKGICEKDSFYVLRSEFEFWRNLLVGGMLVSVFLMLLTMLFKK